MRGAPAALGWMLLAAAPAVAQVPGRTVIDLSHAFGAETVYWPTAAPFSLDVQSAGVTESGFWYAANTFCAAEHGGTHLDAPIHFAAGKRTSEQIPLDDLIGPAVVVDVTPVDDADHLIDVAGLQRWERAHGQIPPRQIVLLRTGWGTRWPDPARYLGTAERGPEAVPLLRFPGLDPEAARWLVDERSVKAVGIDTASIDRGQSTDFAAHRVLADADIPIFENVANLERLPARGATVVALPMKIVGGSGGPMRIIAFVPDDEE